MFSDLIFAYDAMMNAANLSSKVTSNLFTVKSDKTVLNTKLSFKLIYISLFSLYMLIFILAGLIPIIKYAKKGKEIYDCKKTAKYMLVLFILNLLTISISFYYFFSSSIFD